MQNRDGVLPAEVVVLDGERSNRLDSTEGDRGPSNGVVFVKDNWVRGIRSAGAKTGNLGTPKEAKVLPATMSEKVY
jgi:hypothetical protein